MHYRPLSSLDSGSTYEYQVRHECEAGIWSEYSDSFSFTTTGESTGGETTEEEESGEGEATETEALCSEVPTDHFVVGYATSSGVTAYLTQVSGGEMYRFRYRLAGTESGWTVTSETSSTSQNITGLSGNSTYEVQILSLIHI